ncbi:hypothetical protein [Sphingopyxis yananensis]|uniref:hypothetical protein n=1 Tax=Sphingopyxis yananensis TaxID=2886687 RepID=UPI001D108865|nr:hypothetical protein [Sphingopyxis yananensis]MCC2601923.1 hypothetical protein [Sphingopyxis yananensis]
MTTLVLRGAIILWAAAFLFLGLRGLMDPGVYADNFAIRIDAAAANTMRADFSAFFLVAAGGALLGAVIPAWTKALLVPAALFGTALVGRLIGASMGDFVNNGIVQAMMIEALSLVLMAGGWWILSRAPKKTGAGVPDHANISRELVEEFPVTEHQPPR